MNNIKYSEEHEWAIISGASATVGISDYAQEQLGDIVYVELPKIGIEIARGEEVAVVESVKAASEIYAPLSGIIEEVNEALDDDPALVNREAISGGWLFKIRLTNPTETEELMEQDKYVGYLNNFK